MKKIYLLATALALMTMASCTDNDFVGDQSLLENSGNEAIVFNSGFKTITRGDKFGADAADMLGGKFYVGGFKHDGTSYSTVFDNYMVQWGANTAGTTTDNTSDWKYVGLTPLGFTGHITSGEQTIKYWDFAASYYDFVAYSPGKGQNIIITGSTSENNILATAIDKDNLTTAAYTLQGSAEDLADCYIADLVTAIKSGASTPDVEYNKEVPFKFRRLGSKVRIALYETIPGYSVRDVYFYSDDATTTIATGTSNTNATLFTSSSVFYPNGTMTVKYPNIGTANRDATDYNKAHVSFVGTGTATATKSFGSLKYEESAANWEDSRLNYTSNPNKYLKRTSTSPSFAGTDDPYYITVLPDEAGNVLELRVDYTLEAIDGTKETITIHGAKAFVPQVYAQWQPNYAYTYLFKISDNTNGWTSTVNTDLAGLYPITFDAIVLDSQDGTQSTITTVATPAITTYQKGHVYSASDEYIVPSTPDAEAAASNDAIYAQVMNNGTLVTDLNGSNKSYFYKLTDAGQRYTSQPTGWPTGYYTDPACTTPASGTFSNETTYYTKTWTEANVMEALNIRTSGETTTVVGRNGITLTPATANYAVVQIPGEDDNWITKYNNSGTLTNIAAGMVAKLSPDAAGTYAYVYDATSDSPTATYIYTAVGFGTSSTQPSDWSGNYWDNPNGTGSAVTTFEAPSSGTKYYYRRYTNQNRVYGVKVIKVVAAPTPEP